MHHWNSGLKIGMNKIFNKRNLTIAAICVLTFICFRYSLHNQFTNWDDDVYVSNDPYIKALTWDNLKTIFTEDITKNNFHPLCMLSLAINYHFAELQPATYYLTNILIHIANVALIFILFNLLCTQLKIPDKGKYFIASFGALWFGIHPMHVESVSWIAERKDVLYAFFYIAGLITYIKHKTERKDKWFWMTFGLFIASCLSKPMAVVFPLSLICIDFLLEGKFSWKSILQKTPFFLASLVCGAFAIYTQNKTGAIAPFSELSIGERIMYASYGFDMYIYKLFDPTHLSTFYPYPYRYISGYLPSIYYLAPFIAIIILALPLWITYKKNKTYFKVVLFGYGFFVANIMFVLQFISCGAAIMADRYSYVAYIGLLFLLAYFMYELIQRIPSAKVIVLAVLVVWSGALSYLCYKRTYVWHNAETLLKDAIVKYPYRALLSYKWLGNYYMDKGETDSALANYTVLTTLHAADAKIYDEVGEIYATKGDYNKALEAFANSLRIQNNVYKTYLDRARTYQALGDTANANRDYMMAYSLNPQLTKMPAESKEMNSEKVLAGQAFTLVQNKQYEQALAKYNDLVKVNPNNPYYYFYRGVAYFGLGKIGQAADDWRITVKFNDKGVSPNAAYNLVVASDSLGDDSAAIYYAGVASKLGYAIDTAYLNRLKMKLQKQKSRQ